MKFNYHHNLKKYHQRGFTLVETVIAILILSLSIGALLTLTAGGFFSVRYARNQIVADNLAQEALEYIRNSRDTAMLQGVSWNTWLQTLNVDENGQPVDLGTPSGCFVERGCSVDPYTADEKVLACGTCPTTLLYPDEGFYGYQGGNYPFSGGAAPVATTYVRRINVTQPSSADQLTITVTMSWQNGTNLKTTTQSTMVTNWNI